MHMTGSSVFRNREKIHMNIEILVYEHRKRKQNKQRAKHRKTDRTACKFKLNQHFNPNVYREIQRNPN